MTEKQVLEETIAKWNDSVNDISKFKFNSKEVDLFCGMLKRFGEMKVSQALNLTDVVATLPNINSSVFKNWLKVNKYAETMNRLVYSKKDWDYDIDVLYRAFTNEIEFGN